MIKAVDARVLPFCVNGQRIVPVAGAAFGMHGQLVIAVAEIFAQLLAEGTGCFGIAVVVIDAPRAIDIIELTSGAVVLVLARNHALMEERDDRAVAAYKLPREQVKSIIFRYVFIYYNRVRIYTRNPLGLPPVKYREWAQAQMAA